MRALLLLALLAAAPLRAQTPAPQPVPLGLRAGDQDGVSRLVLDLPAGTGWDLGQAGRAVTLRFPGLALGFDTAAIFPGRQASRVLSALSRTEVTGTILVLTLACDCTAEGFTLGPRRLVIDVRDTPGPPAPDPTAAAEPAPAPALPPVPLLPRQRAETSPDLAGEDHAAIAAARDLLMQKLARAAEQGLVNREPGAVPPPDDPPADPSHDPAAADPAAAEADPPGPEPHAADPSAPDPHAPDPHAAETHAADPHAAETHAPETPAPVAGPPSDPALEVRTAHDRDAALDGAPPGTVPARCLPDADLDLAAWGGAEPVARQIALARAALIGEFDRPDPAAVERLARLYTHYGFGLEAEDVLAHMGVSLRSAPLITDFARLLEGRPLTPDGPLQEQAGCPGRAALWGFLAGIDPETGTPRDPDLPPPDVPAVMAAFDELPIEPRRLIGPRLATGFLDMGMTTEAGRVLTLLRRAPGDPGDAFHLARARLLDAEGRPEEAEAIWQALIADNRSAAPRAMIELAESRLARGIAPPATLPSDLADQAQAQRRTPEGARLRMAEIEARAAAGDIDAALGLVAEGIATVPEQEAELRDIAARILARARSSVSGPAKYAAAVLAFRDLIPRGLRGDPARLIVAGELSGLGLPNAALDILDPALERGSEAARLAAARAHVALTEPEPATALLDGIAGPEAAALRAEALAQGGDYAGALAELSASPENAEARAKLAWAAGDWKDALGSADPETRVMAAYMAGLDPAAAGLPEPAPPAAPGTAPAAPAATDPKTAPRSPLEAFLTPPRLKEEMSLGLARDAIDVARSTRDLLARRLATPAPPAPGG